MMLFRVRRLPEADVDLILDPKPPKELIDSVLAPRGFHDVTRQAYRMVTALSERSHLIFFQTVDADIFLPQSYQDYSIE